MTGSLCSIRNDMRLHSTIVAFSVDVLSAYTMQISPSDVSDMLFDIEIQTDQGCSQQLIRISFEGLPLLEGSSRHSRILVHPSSLDRDLLADALYQDHQRLVSFLKNSNTHVTVEMPNPAELLYCPLHVGPYQIPVRFVRTA